MRTPLPVRHVTNSRLRSQCRRPVRIRGCTPKGAHIAAYPPLPACKIRSGPRCEAVVYRSSHHPIRGLDRLEGWVYRVGILQGGACHHTVTLFMIRRLACTAAQLQTPGVV